MLRKKKEQPKVVENNQAGSPEQPDNQAHTPVDDQQTREIETLEAALVQKIAELEIGVIELQEKNSDLNNKFLRLFSEFDNFRKRTMKEKADLIKTASEEVTVSLLPVIDDMERALNSLNNDSESSNAYYEGFKLIYNKMNNILKQRGLEEIEAMGHTFDTDLHEAIGQMPALSEEFKGTVAEVVQKGFLLNGKVIRHAKVVTAS
ncbi:MAG TPA: nucleotide exchange factor GrpE [Bacteroidales bacterium]|nr:nucleotide exchange factor GrpE [Bacteroidales bacterium]